MAVGDSFEMLRNGFNRPSPDKGYCGFNYGPNVLGKFYKLGFGAGLFQSLRYFNCRFGEDGKIHFEPYKEER